MGSCLVEVNHIRLEVTLKLLLLQNQQMIQAFLSDAPQETLTDGIGSWRVNRRFEQLDTARFRHSSKARPKFAVVIPDQILWRLSIWGGFSQLLRHPGIRRRSGYAHVDHLP
jgi:hypothetical protein